MSAPLCRNGLHNFTGKNIYFSDGHKRCRLCRNLRSQAYRTRKTVGVVLDKTLCRKQLHPKVEGQHRCLACRQDGHRRHCAKLCTAKAHAEAKRATRWATKVMPQIGFSAAEVAAYVSGKGWRTKPPGRRYNTPMDAELSRIAELTKGASHE